MTLSNQQLHLGGIMHATGKKLITAQCLLLEVEYYMVLSNIHINDN